MPVNSNDFHNSRNNKILFILSIATALYWFTGKFLNVYYFAFTGAVFELLWLFMLASVLILPIVSVLFFARDKLNLRSLALYSLLLILTVFALLLSDKSLK